MMSNVTGAVDFTPCQDLETTFVAGGVTFVSLTLLLSLTFNGLIFASLYMDSSLRSLPYAFIVNLAVTDVLSSLILIPMDIMYLVSFPNLPFPRIVNNLRNTVFLSLLAASILNFTAVSMDRYIRIRYPLHYMYYLTKGRVTQSVVLLWIYVLVLGVLLFFAFNNPIDGVYTFRISAAYFIPFLIFNVFLPFCVIIVLYACIFRIMRRHMRCIDVQTMARLRYSQCRVIPVRRQNSLLRDLSSSKTVCLVIFGFSLTWFSFLVFQLYYMYCNKLACMLVKVDIVVCWLTYFSAVSNPVIYAAREKKFKNVLQRIFSALGNFQ